MARSENQKLKLAYIYRMLMEETDENHTLTVGDIIDRLGKLGVKAERKSIYDDIKSLQDLGVDVVSERSRANCYFIGDRDFQLPELKLLVDAVASCRSIPANKSNDLIKKLGKLTSSHCAKQLERQVHVVNRVKSIREGVLYAVDKLNTAILEGKKVSFKYWEWTYERKTRLRKDGKDYIASPCALWWDNGNYYLVTYSSKYEHFVHYRVDRLKDVRVLEEQSEFNGKDNKFDISKYANAHFGMYGGELTKVRIYFDNALANPVFDQFGPEVEVYKSGKQGFEISEQVVVSPQFFSWLAGFGDGAKLLTPSAVVKDFKKFLNNILKNY